MPIRTRYINRVLLAHRTQKSGAKYTFFFRKILGVYSRILPEGQMVRIDTRYITGFCWHTERTTVVPNIVLYIGANTPLMPLSVPTPAAIPQ